MSRTFLLLTVRCLDADSERSYQDLFERLDTNKDGKVDVAELRAGLKAMGIFRQGAAQVNVYTSKEREGRVLQSFMSWPACFAWISLVG